MQYSDITKTGALSFRDLQLMNDKDFATERANHTNPYIQQQRSFTKSREYDPNENAVQQVRSSLYGTSTSWGESMFDEGAANANAFEQLQDIRANNQSAIFKLGAGIGKGVALAGTTFLDGTLGLLVGGAEAIATQDFSKIWNNEVSNGLQTFNKKMEEWLPNYYTKEEQEQSWLSNLGSINFWADKVIKNIGFTVGAFYSGGIAARGLKTAGKLAQSLGSLSSAMKPIQVLGTAMQTNGIGAKLTGALVSAVNEARIEANHTTTDLRELQVQQASDAAEQKIKEIEDNPYLTSEQKTAAISEVENNYDLALASIDDNLKKAGLTDFLLNVPILALNDFWTFGRLYAQGFQGAKNVASKNVKKSFLGRASQAANEAAETAANPLIQNTKKEGGKYVWDTISKKKSWGQGLLTGLREGNEEMMQGWASEFAGNYAFYSDSPDTYYRAMTDPKALLDTMDTWEAASKAFANTYGNGDRYEEFAIGALTGLLGTPTFGKKQNSSANTYLGRGKVFGLSGGLAGQLKADAEMNQLGEAHIQRMSDAVNKRNQIDRTARVHAAMSQFADVMNGFAEEDDKFEFNNMSDNLDWMGITSFISTGRENDLKEILSQDFDNISDEELEAIAALTAQNDGSNIGGFREKGSNKLITADSPQSDKDAMRAKLNKNKQKMLDELDSYKDSVSLIRNYAADNPNVTEEKINELAWMHWKTSRFNSRAAEIKKDNAEQFVLIAQALEEFNKKQQEILDKKEESTEGLSAAAMSVAENKNVQLAKAKANAQHNLEYSSILLSIINSVASANQSVMPYLAPMLQMDKGFLEEVLKSDNFYDLAVSRGLSKVEFDKIIRDIRDLGRLAEASKTFNDKLKEYMENPFKQDADHEKMDSENAAVEQEIHKESNRKKAKKVTRQQILNGEADADDVINNTRSDDAERQLAQDAKVTLQVRQRVETIIAQKAQEGTISNEDAEMVDSAIQQRITQSQSINDLTGNNAAFMVDANGQPLSDEQITLIQELVNQAAKDVAEANSLNIKEGEIVFNTIDEIDQSRTGPTNKQTTFTEEAINKEERQVTGSDAVEKAVAVNANGVPGNLEQAITRGRSKKGSSKSQQRGQQSRKNLATQKTLNKNARKAATKAAAEKAEKEAAASKKHNIVTAALTFAINGNALNISTSTGQQEIQLLSDILSRAYDLIEEGKIKKLSGIMQVLMAMDEYEKLQQMLQRNPNLGSAIKSISDNLSKTFGAEEDVTDSATELERLLGPETVSTERVSPEAYSSQNLNPPINMQSYFAPATSQYYRDPQTGRISSEPFTKKAKGLSSARKKKLEVTYNYLVQHNAFHNASKVKAGQDIYFTIHPSLNKDAGDVIILMSTDPEGTHIVGDLADTESATYQNNQFLKAMVERITKEFNDRTDKDSSEPFVSKEKSSVRQTMVGHVLFTDSKSTATDKTLNIVFGEGQFKMGVANASGDIITTNQGDQSVSGDLYVVTPKKRFTSGTPVVLIPTGEGTKKYVAVPFQMSKYNSSMKGTKFHQYAETILKRVLLSKEGNPLDLSSNKAQIMVKSALQALFNGDFHVNFNNGQLVIHQTFKTVKDGVEKKKNEYFYRGTLSPNIVNILLNAFQQKGMIIRIDRRAINRDSKLKDLDFTYNDMIGELAHTNLSDKSSSTVNDWFVVNPVNEKGEIISIDRVPYRDTRIGKDAPQRNDTTVEYKGQTYLVSEEDVIVNKDGTPRTDLSIADQQIILAKAELEKNDLITSIGTEGEQVFWYSLGDGSLFYNKNGEERLVVSEAEKQAVIDSFTKPQNSSVNTPSGPQNEEADKKPVKNSYPAGFDTDDLKEFFDSFSDANKEVLRNAGPDLLQAVSMIITANIDDLDQAKEDIEHRLKEQSAKYRTVNEEEGYTPADLDTEVAWLKKALPQLADEDHLRIVKGLIKIAGKDNPRYAYGKTQQGIMTISDAAASGTVYHEAFHSVIDVLLNEDEVEKLFNKGAKKYGLERGNLKNEIAIEENLAEDFRRYIQKERDYRKDLEQSSGLSKIFKILKHTAKIWLDNTSYINNMFYRINQGKMSNRALRSPNNSSVSKYSQFTEEERAILDKAPRNSKSNNIRYRESDITSEDIIQYHQERLDYANLEDAQKALLEDRGITEEQYSFLTQAEKENLLKCLF